ncbi:Fructose-1,6-bisphosphatase isozyme 2 [Striga asiatica]|uniref:Fructose-1,6-bisphosphatase isozyme 2 n=1 Tax=Striga asiatica TaxID=4170 RepID=A0A5A7QUB5_STRAF|nr:Fructose-1,6-bisphosphatase isozyme 2 [Striga asiatica]
MEIKNNVCLQSLARRTWDLHVRINEKINQINGFSFCSDCSNHGRYCVVAEGSLREKEKMMSIRDSLKDVHNILIFLQGLKSSQNKQRDDALSHLEESIKIVIQRINEYPKKGRENVEVLEELITTFVNFQMKIDEKAKHKNVFGIGRSNFVVGVARFGVEFVVAFASIYATVKLHNGRHKNSNKLEKDIVAPSNIHLDVLSGRG